MVKGVGLENRRIVIYLAGSNPVPLLSDRSLTGRALVLQVRGCGFKSHRLHQYVT